jgi:hypothetical protein
VRRANLTFLFLVAMTAIDVLIAVRFFTVSPPICGCVTWEGVQLQPSIIP